MLMKPKKELIERARSNGSIERLNILLSASHILNCTSNQYAEEAASLMEENGLLIGRLKQLHNNFLKSADQYFSEFARMIFEQETKMDLFSNMESFDRVFRQWSRIEKDWEPKKVEYKDGKWMPVKNEEENE